MSADDYWAIRKVHDGFMAYHGYMSDLEYGRRARRPMRNEPFATWDEAAKAADAEWSEYGLILEHAALSGSTRTGEDWRTLHSSQKATGSSRSKPRPLSGKPANDMTGRSNESRVQRHPA